MEANQDNANVIKNGLIDQASLLFNNGAIVASIKISYGNGQEQRFGNYAMYCPQGTEGFAGQSNMAGDFISGVLRVAGAPSWADLVGKAVRVHANNEKIHGLGHIVAEDWFLPSEGLAAMIKANTEHHAARTKADPSMADLLGEVRAHLTTVTPPGNAAAAKRQRSDARAIAKKIDAVLGDIADAEVKTADAA